MVPADDEGSVLILGIGAVSILITVLLVGVDVAGLAMRHHDAELTVLFHRRHLRTHMALGPAGSSMTRHYQCQRFDGAPTRVVQL